MKIMPNSISGCSGSIQGIWIKEIGTNSLSTESANLLSSCCFSDIVGQIPVGGIKY